MSLAIGFGVVAFLAAAWAARERVAAAAAGRVSAATIEAARAERDVARQAEAELARRLREAEHTAEELGERVLRVDATSSELRRALAGAQSERERLARLAEEAPLADAARIAAEEERDGLRMRLEAAERAVSRLREVGQDGSRPFLARMEELDRQNRDLASRVETWARRAQAAETELSRRESGRASDEVTLERDALRARVEALEAVLRSGARQRAAVKVLGVAEPVRDAAMFNAERRVATDAALREAYLAAGAAGAALLDARGTPWLRYGNPRIVERLGATVALLSAAPVEAALGAPPRLASETFGVYGRHLAWLPGADVWLAATGSRECPALVLRLATLKLAGAASPVPATARPGPTPALEPTLSDRLDAWVARRRAIAAAALGGAEPAATDSGFAAACAPLLPVVRALAARAARDGFHDGLTLAWRAEDDATLVARALEDGRVLFARFSAPPAPRLLDDLAATVRWASAPLVAAS